MMMNRIDLGADVVEVSLSGGRTFTIQRPSSADPAEFARFVTEMARSDDPRTIIEAVYARWTRDGEQRS